MHQFVRARALCSVRYVCPAAEDCSGTIPTIHMRTTEWPRVTSMHANVIDFMIRGRLTRPRGPFRAQGSALTRNVSSSHGSKNLLQRAMLYRHERIYLVEQATVCLFTERNTHAGDLAIRGRLQALTKENYM